MSVKWDNGSVDELIWDMQVDFCDVYDGLLHGSLGDARPEAVIAPGRYIVVGDDDAVPAVAQVVEIKPNGIVYLKVLPGHAKLHLSLLESQPA